MIKLVALLLPLCLDTFAVAAAIGMAESASAGRRVRLGLLFAAFEGGMPLLGLLAGAGLGQALGGVAEYVAIAALAGIGVYMLRGGEEDEESRARLLGRTHGVAMLGLGVSISLDELAMGFTLGLLKVPIVPAIALVAGQAFVASQVGLALGGRVGEAVREGAERLAGAVLLGLAGLLLLARLLGLSL